MKQPRHLSKSRQKGNPPSPLSQRLGGVTKPKPSVKSAPGHQYKWRLAMGTTSRVPNSKLHYLIADFDAEKPRLGMVVALQPDNIFVQRTPNGWHVYTDLQYTFSKLCQTLDIVGADRSWISIGKSRGYFFLADKGPVPLPWPVERMKLHAKKR